MTGSQAGSSPFDAYYFAHACGRPYERNEEWLAFFGSIADRIVSEIQPRTVLDAGCAMGFLVEALRQRGVEAFGVDVSEYAIEHVHPSVRPYCWRGSVTEPLPQRYDLIVCIEVLEHLPAQEAEEAVANLCRSADDILHSATPYDYKEVTHFNVQPPEYWAEVFARHGFFRDVDFDASFITPWGARFRQRREPLPRIVREYERRFWLLWKENTDLRGLTVEIRDKLALAESREKSLVAEVAAQRQQAEALAEHVNGVLASRSWRLLSGLRQVRLRLIPLGSARDRAFLTVVEALEALAGGCVKAAFRRLLGRQQMSLSGVQGEETPSVSARITTETYSLHEEKDPFRQDFLRLALYSLDPLTAACPHLRVAGPAADAHAKIEVIEGASWKEGSLDVSFPDEADVILIQRDFPRQEAQYDKVVRWARSRGKPVAYELDDLLLELPWEHPEKEYYDSARAQMLQAIVDADAVVASTQGIADYVRRFNPNTWLLPNYLDDQIWELRQVPKDRSSWVILGYMGGMTRTHLPDLEPVVPILKKLLQRYPDEVRLRFWGLVPPELAGLPNVEFREETFPDYTAFADYFSKQECDVFIAPLRDNLFNGCKSWIKFLEYSALGAPGVYSRLEPYEALVVHGENGFLASTAAEWEIALGRLIEDRHLRVSIGQAAQETVRRRFLLSKHAHEWGIVYRAILSSAGTRSHVSPRPLVDQQLRQWESEKSSRLKAASDLGDKTSAKDKVRSREKALEPVRGVRLLLKRGLIVLRREGTITFARMAARKLLRKPLELMKARALESVGSIGDNLGRPDANRRDGLLRLGQPPPVSIILPVYNGLEYVRECVESIYDAPVGIRFEVVAIDQKSRDGSREFLRSCAKDRPNFRLIENETNVGFTRAVNQGAAAARGEFLVIANSDVIFTAGWLDRLVKAMHDEPALAVASPVTNYVGEGPQIDPDARDVTADRAAAYAEHVADRQGILPVVDRLVFFCVLVRKKIFDYLGGFADVFSLGNYEDDDFCLRARMAGFKLGIVPGAFVFHYGSRTFREQRIDYTALMRRNEKVFFERACSFATQFPYLRGRSEQRDAPHVSVVLRTKDRPYLLKQALASLANQTLMDFEVLVVNDGGVDVAPVLEAFFPYITVKYIETAPPRGRSAALNAGSARASGRYITYLDDDDVVYPTHLEHLLSALSSSGGYRVSYSDVNKALCWSDSRRDAVLERTQFARREFDPNALLVENWIPIMSFMHATDCLRAVGGFDEELGIFEDWDLLIRLAQAYSFHHVPRITCEYRFRFGEGPDDSTLRSREKALQTMALIHERYPTEDPSLQDQRAIAIRAARQIIEEIEEIDSVVPDELTRNLLVTARLGSFSTSLTRGEADWRALVRGS